MSNENKSRIISRLNRDWEATVTFALPIAILNKFAQKAAKRGEKPVDFMKQVLTAIALKKESK